MPCLFNVSHTSEENAESDTPPVKIPLVCGP
jgi:hypothetical protein